MSDQILSQEEIDALLSAMDSGEVDLEEEAKPETEAVAYNLTSQNIMLRDQFYALEEVYDKFATLLNTILLRISMVDRIDSLRYQANAKYPTGFFILLSLLFFASGFTGVYIYFNLI